MSAKILLVDIECTNLNADFGVCLAFGYKWFGDKKAKCITVHDHPGANVLDDKPLLVEASKIWAEADIVVTWYGLGFDQPFLNSRLIFHRLPILKDVYHLDLWKTSRKQLKFRNNRLATVSEALRTTQKKTPIDPDAWIKILFGDKKAMKYIKEHCLADVDTLEEVYELMRPLVKAHPRVTHDNWKCRSCGSDRLVRRGWKYSAAKGKQIQTVCKACGSWTALNMKESAKLDETV